MYSYQRIDINMYVAGCCNASRWSLFLVKYKNLKDFYMYFRRRCHYEVARMIIVTSPCLLKILIFAVLSLILVQYMYSSIQLRDSNRIDPLFVINASGGSHETLFSSESDDNAKNLSSWIYSQVH